MRGMILPALVLASAFASSIASTRAESISTCDEVKKTSGMAKYLLCVAKQPIKNYPATGQGMMMDEIETQTDKIADGICNGEGTVCDGEKPGTKFGNCVCQ